VTLVTSSVVNSVSEQYGAALAVVLGSVILRGSSIINSIAYRGGSALSIHSGSVLLTDGSTISQSWAELFQGAAASIWGGTLTVEGRSTIADSSGASFGGAMYISGGVVTLNDSLITRSEARLTGAGAFYLKGGDLHLFNATVEDSTSAETTGIILIVSSGSILGSGLGPLFMATLTEFRQRSCNGVMFGLQGTAQVVLRDVTFTPLDGCDTAALASPAAFHGVAPKGCGETYSDRQGNTWGVCRLSGQDVCSALPVPGTNLTSLRCVCPRPEFIPNPAVAHSESAPYLQSPRPTGTAVGELIPIGTDLPGGS
jgi:hypothetical protein